MRLRIRASRNLMRLGLLLLLAVSALHGQTMHLGPSSPGAVQILSPAWRFLPADDPAFALVRQPDASWPLVAPQQTPPAAPVHVRGQTYSWARLHLTGNSAAEPLSFALITGSVCAYQVYVNGQLAEQSPGFAESHLFYVQPRPIALPPAGDVLIAVRFVSPSSVGMRRFPISAVMVGTSAALETELRFRRVHEFAESQIAELLSAALALAMALFAGVLFAAQRTRREYLWLTLLNLCYVFYVVDGLLIRTGALSSDLPSMLLYRILGCLCNILLLEFVPLLTRVRRLLAGRVLEWILLVLPALSFYSDSLFSYTLVLLIACVVAVLCTYFGKALRYRNQEALLLCLPMGLLLVASIVRFGNLLLPARVPYPGHLALGEVGIAADQAAIYLLFFATFAIVLRRFVQVSLAEQQTAAELDAARTVQQLLIPDTASVIPGFQLESVYKPAREVGGDFFQVISLPAGALVAVGDVSGKGVPAAMTVALLVGTLRTIAQQTHSPALILETLNGVLCERSAGFTTCLLFLLDQARSDLVVSGAGHLEPYLEGAPLGVAANLPLGLSRDVHFSNQTFSFPPGQRLTLLTDGVVEASHAQTHELFGFERTAAVSHLSASGIAEQLERFTAGAPAADDVTILTITRTTRDKLERPPQTIHPEIMECPPQALQ